MIDNGFTGKRGNVPFGELDPLGVIVERNNFAGRVGVSYSG